MGRKTASLHKGLLALGMLLVLASLAGLTATVVSRSSPENPARRESGIGGDSGLHPQRIEGKFGYADASGRIIIPARFDGADAFSEGRAVVLDSGRFGYIDSRGVFAIPAVYRHARAFRKGHASVRFGGAWLTIDTIGRPVDVVLPARN
ncbi:MAG: WG repeat-containing protein [Fibrobacteria bacterium]